MKKTINILIAAGAVVLAGIIVVLLFLTGVISTGGKNEPTLSDPGPVRSETPSPSPSSPPPPASTAPPPSPTPTPEPVNASIPGSGGEVRVVDSAEFELTPDRGGVWVIFTFDNEDDDPNLTLMDSNGNEIVYDDDSAGSYNAVIITELDAGVTYIIAAGIYGNLPGSFTVSAKPAEILAGGGDTVRVQSTAGFAFTPDESGMWEFRTSDNDDDPWLGLYDNTGWYIAEDDDSGGNLNALIRRDLIGGTTYCIFARNIAGSPGAFTLNVAQSSGITEPQDFGEGVESYYNMEPGEGIEFTPDVDGIWIIFTSDNGDIDPMLEIYGPDFNLLAENDDGPDGLNAMLVMFLNGGETYSVVTKTYNDSYGTCTLNFKAPIYIPSSDIDISVNSSSSYVFIPDRSGTYEFRTSNNGYDDPCVDVFDANGDFIDGDDDGGDNYNAWLSIDLEAGETYYIFVSFYMSVLGACTLSVTG